MTNTDLELLRRYVHDHADEAFAEIVRRHLNLVYSAALRQVRSPQLAEEVAQSAFTDLARTAPRLAPDTILTAWLYQVTRRTAVDVVRREARRQLREQIATELNAMNATTDEWTHIEPLLDEAMHTLDETDRAAVLLRYFENKSLREVGQALGTSDDAAQKRVSRAVERLRQFFAKHGITTGASGLTAIISAKAVHAAPVGLALTICTAARLVGTSLGTAGAAAKTMTLTALQKTIIGTTLAAAIGVGIHQANQATRLRGQVDMLQRQRAPLTEQLAHLTSENERLSNLVAQGDLSAAEQAARRPDAQANGPRQAGSNISDLELRLREAVKLPDRERPRRLQEIAGSIALSEMPAAVALGQSLLTINQDRLTFLTTLMQHWGDTDPAGALAFVQTSSEIKANPDEQQWFIRTILEGWARKDADTAFTWVEKLPDGIEKQSYFALVLSVLVESDTSKALDKIKAMPAGRARDAALQRIALDLAGKNPKAAADFGVLLPAGSTRDQFLQRLTASWIRTDPQAATHFILDLPASGSRDELMRAAVCEWAKVDPTAAAKFSETLPFNRMWAMTGVAYYWAATDTAAAWQWSLAIADDETRRSALGGVLRCLATRSRLEEAAQYASQLAGDDQVRAVRSLLIDSSDLDPEWTARWVGTFPAGETRNQAVEKLVQHWSQSDPIATARWLAEQPQDQSFQEGARRLIPGMLKASPSVAWDWAMVLTDPATKQQQLEVVAKGWLASNADEARKKIQSSGLTRDQISKLLEPKR